jgi:hypothetical protein
MSYAGWFVGRPAENWAGWWRPMDSARELNSGRYAPTSHPGVSPQVRGKSTYVKWLPYEVAGYFSDVAV